MPNVPVDNLPQVTPGQRPDVRLNPNAPLDAFGGGPGVADAYGQARGLAGDVGKMAYQEYQEKNRSDVDDAVVQLSQLQQKVLKDPNTGALAARGEAAIPASQQAMEDFKKGAQAIDASLTDPEQKRMFRSKLTEYHVQTSGILSNHVFGQIQEKKATSLAASAEQFGNAAESFATTDLSLVKSNLQDQEKKIRELSAFNGLDGPSTEYAVRKGLSQSNLRVLNMMTASGNDLVAKGYYAENQKAFIDHDAIEAARMVKRGSILGEATRLSDEAFQGTLAVHSFDGQDIYTEGAKTITDLQAKALKIEDPEVRQEFMRLGRQRLEDTANGIHQVSVSAFDDIAKKMQDPANANKSPRDLATPDQWENQLTPAHRDGLVRMFAKERVTDPQTQIAWWALQADPRKVAALDNATLWTQYLSKMSEGEAAKAGEEWKKARQDVAGNPLKAAEAKSMFSDKELVMNSMAAIGAGGLSTQDDMESIRKNSDKSASFFQFASKVDDAWLQFQQRNNGKIGDADRKRILGELLRDETPVAVPIGNNYEYDVMKRMYPNYTPGPGDVPASQGFKTKAFKDLSEEDRKTFMVQAQSIPAPVLRDMTDFIQQLPGNKRVTTDKLQRMRRARLLGDDAQYIRIANE